MSQTIQGGALVGTSGNDDLRTLYYDIATATTTIYSALSGLGGDDALNNNGKVDNVTLDGGADNDRIYNTVSGGGQSPSIIGGAGNDYIQNGYATDQLKAKNPTIDAGAGADTVENYGDNALINLDNGDDSLYNVGDKATISAGAGADNISHFGDNSSIDAGAGDDTVGGSGNNVTIRGGAGNDSLNGYGNSSVDSKILLDDTIGTNYFHITNSTNSTINAGSGADTINSDGHNENLLINAGAGNNSIVSNYDSNITINAGAGNDSITIYDGNGNLIQAGEGNNYIYSYNLNSNLADMTDFTISSGAGKDTLSTYGNRVSIVSGAGNDSITHVGANSTIQGGDGDDYINNNDGGRDYSKNPSIGANNLVEGGAGNDSIGNACDNVTLNGGDGNDYISSGAVNGALLNGGNGNDTLSNLSNINREFPTNTTLNGGAGNDSIDNLGNNVTISGGTGNDTISLRTGRDAARRGTGSENVLINYTSGDGNDLIQYFSENSTLSIGGGNYSSEISGSDVILTVGNGKITLSEAATLDNLNIIGNGSNEIPNSEFDVVVTGTNAAEKFENKGYNVTINALGGNDTINNYGNHVSINAGKGDDLINTDLDPNADDDVTIHYAAGDGNDSVYGHMSDDGAMNYKLQITGSAYSSAVSGEDVVLTVGTDSILLYGAADAASMGGINIDGTLSGGDTTPADTTPADDTTTAAAATVAEMILRRTEAGYPAMAALAFDPTTYFGPEPTNYASKENWSITSTDGLKLKGYHYTPENSNDKWVVIVHGYGHNHKHMYRFAEFYLANNYNVLMVDQRAAGDSQGDWLTMGAAESKDIALWTQEIARRNSDAKITLFGVSMGAATVMLSAARSDTQNVTSLVEDCGYTNMMDVVYGLHSNVQAIKDLLPTELIPVLDTVASTFTGYNLSDAAPLASISSAKMPTLFITGTNDSVVPVSMLTALYDASGATVKEKFLVEGANHGIAGLTDPVGYSNTTFRFLAEANGEGWVTDNAVDSILLRGTKYNDNFTNSGDNVTITAGKDNDSISNSGTNVRFNYASGDGNDYITGFNATSTLSISGGNYTSQTSGNDVILTVGNGNVSLIGAGSLSTLNIVGGSATQAPDTTLPDTTSADTTPPDTTPPDTTPADPKLLTVSNLSKSPITLGDNTETVDASARVVAVEIIGNDLNNSIVGGINNDTLNGGAGNDTLTGGKGKNIFIYSAGDDIITDYKEGKDSIQLDGATISNQTLSGSDVVIKTSSGSLTLTDAIGKEINIDGETIVVGVAPGPENLTVNNQTKSPVNLGTATKTVDASKRILRVEIIGNDLDNTINGGANSDTISGGNGNDLILGNAGNDIINGDAGNDILRGGSGNDTLNGGAGNDSLWGDKGADTFIYDSGDDVIYGFDNKDLLEISGDFTSSYANDEIKLTIGNGSITLKEFTATSFNINGDSYVISEGNFVKK